MTIKIRSLVVSGVCLVGIACSDAAPPAAQKKAEAKSVPVLPAPRSSFAQEELAALAATAPARPSTIFDGPEKKKDPERAARDQPLETQSESAKMELAVASGHDEPIDYGRPLSAAEVTLDRFVLASGVEGREPVGESEVFTTGAKIFAFMQLANPDAAPYAFRVHWEPLSGPVSPYGVELHVKTAARFRTWSWTAIPREPGAYRAVLRTLEGEEIASRTFTIEAAKQE